MYMFVLAMQTSESVKGLPVFVVLGAAALSFALVWLGAPIAWLVARWMRNVRGVVAHVMVFWLLGAVTSGIVLLFLSSATGAAQGSDQAGAVLAAAAVCGVCTAIGRSSVFVSEWHHARRRRRREANTAERSTDGQPQPHSQRPPREPGDIGLSPILHDCQVSPSG
ncbi:hypothetical protein QE428_002205 [Microbacterium sp. SORGH_AS 505]|uniref:hypothetical protein n=1 Tax=Microbacterium sp. SORGH_AS_0505 TaxID=3041770 RepID=UPI0027876D2A|nr:hypothetical protein [Microbacterium sp. SORGH_AS_0505]MDQ1127172.1 hypothetical protein [Microbacterium sp. SORGH_AS_0505]